MGKNKNGTIYVIESWTGACWYPATLQGLFTSEIDADNHMWKMGIGEQNRKKAKRRVAVYQRKEPPLGHAEQ